MVVPGLTSESITYQKLQFLFHHIISGNLSTFRKAAVSFGQQNSFHAGCEQDDLKQCSEVANQRRGMGRFVLEFQWI